jgi:hypothetical protein
VALESPIFAPKKERSERGGDLLDGDPCPSPCAHVHSTLVKHAAEPIEEYDVRARMPPANRFEHWNTQERPRDWRCRSKQRDDECRAEKGAAKALKARSPKTHWAAR